MYNEREEEKKEGNKMSLNTTLSRTLEIETYDGRFKKDTISNSEQLIEEMKSTRFAESDELQAEIEDIIALHADLNERVTTSVKMRSPIIYWKNAFRLMKLFTSTLEDTYSLEHHKSYVFNEATYKNFMDAIENEITHLQDNPDETDDRYSQVRTVLPYINGKGPKASSPVEAEISFLEKSLEELQRQLDLAKELEERVDALNRDDNPRLAIRLYYEMYSSR